MTKHLLLLLAASMVLLPGCSSTHKVEVAAVEVKPIHITVDVNVKVDRALDDFFSDLDANNANADTGSKE